MELKANTNLIQIPLWLFNGLCLFLLISKGSLFLNQTSLITLNSDLEKIGHFEIVRGLVKRSHSQSLSWFPAKNSDDAYMGETIFTGLESSARLKIEDNIIELKENSVIKLNKVTKDEYTISLIRGEVKGKIKDKFKVVYRDKKGKEKEVVLPVVEDTPLAFELEEDKEVKTEPLKPLFFENLSSNDVIFQKDLKSGQKLFLSWSGERDKPVILKLIDNNGSLISEKLVKGKKGANVILPKLNTRYLASIQYVGERDISSTSFWTLNSEKVTAPSVYFPSQQKLYGNEETIIHIPLENYEFYLEFGEVTLDVYFEENLHKTVDVTKKDIENGEIKLPIGEFNNFGKYSLSLNGNVDEVGQTFSISSQVFYFLPLELSQKLLLDEEVINLELELKE